jgi:hypothetical protein
MFSAVHDELALFRLLARPGTALVVTETLALLALCCEPIHLPGLTHEAAGTDVLWTLPFVVHRFLSRWAVDHLQMSLI